MTAKIIQFKKSDKKVVVDEEVKDNWNPMTIGLFRHMTSFLPLDSTPFFIEDGNNYNGISKIKLEKVKIDGKIVECLVLVMDKKYSEKG